MGVPKSSKRADVACAWIVLTNLTKIVPASSRATLSRSSVPPLVATSHVRHDFGQREESWDVVYKPGTLSWHVPEQRKSRTLPRKPSQSTPGVYYCTTYYRR